MSVTELSVVNACLATLGEAPLGSLLEYHPLMSAAQQYLADALVHEQAKKYWFGYERAVLTFNPSSGEVILPANIIDVLPIDEPNLVQRGSRLYDVFNGTYDIRREVTVTLIRTLPLEELPVLAQYSVRAKAVLEFQSDYDADPQKTMGLARAYSLAKSELNTEHIRQCKANMLTRPSTQYVQSRIRGSNFR